jgi:hypothetical protein
VVAIDEDHELSDKQRVDLVSRAKLAALIPHDDRGVAAEFGRELYAVPGSERRRA